MKKISSKLNQNKNLVIGIVVGAVVINLIGVISSIAANSVSSNIVLYNSSTGKKNVKDAIDELYTMASTHCPDGHKCYINPTWVDTDSNGVVSEGDTLTYGTESFYVISNDGSIIKMLAKYNLNVGEHKLSGETEGLQSANAFGYNSTTHTFAGDVKFPTSNYWGKVGGTTDTGPVWQWNNSNYENGFVYDNNSSLYPYIETYKNRLKSLGANVIYATLLSSSEANYLFKTKSYNWSANQYYWLGTALGSTSGNPDYMRFIKKDNTISYYLCYKDSVIDNDSREYLEYYGYNEEIHMPYFVHGGIGIRPVIAIPASSV